MESVTKAIGDSKRIHLKIEWGYLPANALHLLALKCGSGGPCVRGGDAVFARADGFFRHADVRLLLVQHFCEPGAHQRQRAHTRRHRRRDGPARRAAEASSFIDADGHDVPLDHYDIALQTRRLRLRFEDRSSRTCRFTIPEKTSTAIVGPSGSGKTTICSLLARFYDPQSGQHHRRRARSARIYLRQSALEHLDGLPERVPLQRHRSARTSSSASPTRRRTEMIAAAKKARCHDFIMALPDGYDTVVGEGGGTLSGGEKQRISIKLHAGGTTPTPSSARTKRACPSPRPKRSTATKR